MVHQLFLSIMLPSSLCLHRSKAQECSTEVAMHCQVTLHRALFSFVVVIDYWGPIRASSSSVLLARASALKGSLVRSTSPCSSSPPNISLFAARVPGHPSHQCFKVWGPSWQVGYTFGTESSSRWLYDLNARCLPLRIRASVTWSFLLAFRALFPCCRLRTPAP